MARRARDAMMIRRMVSSLASISLAVAALAVSSAVFAHPHGTMRCGLLVHFQDGRLHTVAARLLMDQPHSSQALSVLRDPESSQIDAGREQRFLFALKLQMARLGWLLGASADGQEVSLVQASEPTLWLADDGRVGVDVKLQVEAPAAAPSAGAWKFSCQDPTWYWVSEFMQPEAPVTATGCAQPSVSPAVKVATGPLAGGVHVNVQCAP